MNDRLPASRPTAEEAVGRETLTLGEHTSNHIVRAILAYLQERKLQPGDRLPSERALAERLGVGRNALREALATLTTLRVVEARPNSGIYLRRVSTESSFETLVLLADMGASPTRSEIAESLEVRAALEQMAVRLNRRMFVEARCPSASAGRSSSAAGSTPRTSPSGRRAAPCYRACGQPPQSEDADRFNRVHIDFLCKA